MKRFEQLSTELCKLVPFNIRYKDESWGMQVLDVLVSGFCPGFLDRFTTVIGHTIYFPNRSYVTDYPELAMRTLAHEAVHLLDMERVSKPVFMFSYLFPQILALGVFSFPWTGAWSLLFLLCLFPWPAPFRYYFESRAYALDILTAPPAKRDTVMEHAIRHFSSWNYYKMFPYENQVRKRLAYWVKKAETGEDKVLLKVLLHYELIATPE